MRKRTVLAMALIGNGMAHAATTWQLVDDNAYTQMYIDKNSFLVDSEELKNVSYTNILISKTDTNPQLLTGFKLVANVVDNCANNTQSVSAIKVLDAANMLVPNSVMVYQSPRPVKVNLNSPKGKAHVFACSLRANNQAAATITTSPVSLNFQPIKTAEISVVELAKKVEVVEKQGDVRKIKDSEWIYIGSDEKSKLYVQKDNIKFGTKNKLATFYTRLEYIKDSSFPKGQYVVTQNVGNCSRKTIAKLHEAIYDAQDKNLSDKRYPVKTMKFYPLEANTLISQAHQYVCKMKF